MKLQRNPDSPSPFPYPENEQQRLIALASYGIFDTAEEQDFDELAALAGAICGVPVALITFIDEHRQTFKSHFGTELTENLREFSFCTHAIAANDRIMIVEDTREDQRFYQNPMVTGPTNVKFYAGVPLVNEDGMALGTLCVLDQQARRLSPEQQEALIVLGKQVMDKLELRRKVEQLQEANDALSLASKSLGQVHTQQQQSLELISEINSNLDMALRAGRMGWFDIELNTGKVNCTDTCRLNYGLADNEEFNFQELFQSIIPEQKLQVQRAVIAAIEENKIFDIDYQITWKNGEPHWINTWGQPRYDNSGKIERIAGVMQQITMRKGTEKAQEEFLAIVSHELKTPITTLKASIQLMDIMKEEIGNDMVSGLLDTAGKSVTKINHLVDDLLNMHRYSQAELKLEKTIFSITELLGGCCNHVRLGGQHELIIECEKDILVFADEHRIDQVIVNFVNNAVKYATGCNTIYLSAGKTGNFVHVCVKDHGPGLLPEQQERIFDRYWQAKNDREKYSGLGLGLYICAEIIRRHDGEIGVESAPGKGCTFWFTLPADLPS
ncbi:ATP-binding protein [Ferruginibacter sp. HRS2-29]|uniref:ATP-binding protein n=1 Tax=Ferruginibacter sp. HRS2-29 TaxID=2487334 RepID=UPI0020CEC14E|nr:ATP-binding protein [Ferruginibacter sp. HRS2-29]MCP9750550.1 GAF domain-containing protein [Ferruginibacter sp. HRS2-29]